MSRERFPRREPCDRPVWQGCGGGDLVFRPLGKYSAWDGRGKTWKSMGRWRVSWSYEHRLANYFAAGKNRSHKPSLSTRWNRGTRLVVGSHTCAQCSGGIYETGCIPAIALRLGRDFESICFPGFPADLKKPKAGIFLADDSITLASSACRALAILDRHEPTRILDESSLVQHACRHGDDARVPCCRTTLLRKRLYVRYATDRPPKKTMFVMVSQKDH